MPGTLAGLQPIGQVAKASALPMGGMGGLEDVPTSTEVKVEAKEGEKELSLDEMVRRVGEKAPQDVRLHVFT